MKKISILLAALALCASAAYGQSRIDDLNDFSLSKDNARVETHLHVAFPMYFGWSTLTNVNYKGDWSWANAAIGSDFLNTRTGKNFVYGLEMAAIHFSKPGGLVDVSLGIRWTFMDFTLSDSQWTFRKGAPVSSNFMPYLGVNNNNQYFPHRIVEEVANYDGRKSKIHGNYLGIPVRVTFGANKLRVFVGASAEYLISGYTKYKFPKYGQDATPLFNRFRATVEAGMQFGILGVFANYGLTTLFPDSLSDARTLTFGIVLGR